MSGNIHLHIERLIKSMKELTQFEVNEGSQSKSISFVQQRLQDLSQQIGVIPGGSEGKILGEVHCLLQEIRQVVFPGEDRIGARFYQVFKNARMPRAQKMISLSIKEEANLIEKEILSSEKFRLVPKDIMKGGASLAWSLVMEGKVEEAFDLLTIAEGSSRSKMEIVFGILRAVNASDKDSIEFIKQGIKEMFGILGRAKSSDKVELTEFAKDIFEIALKKLSYIVPKEQAAREAILEIVDRAPFGWIGLLPED